MHRCLGCDVERLCRVAADDYIIACMRLVLVNTSEMGIARQNSAEELPA
ncbi:hypothetical protein BH23CHL4_BH23CHL4_03490 [soil metagenome]